jgi:predicted RNA binding protein YcfA (HicA-like mRNA interferase family)
VPSRRDKLIEKIRRRPSEAEFSDVSRLLELFEWKLDRQTGSHFIFVKSGAPTISVPKTGHNKVKRHYLDGICELLGLDD